MKFILPNQGGAMVHSNPQQTDNINLPIPESNVDIIWVKNDLKGEQAGTIGNGIAGNGTIAANTFNGSSDNLIIYDYYGKRIWKSGSLLNPTATTSTPMVSRDKENLVVACDNKSILLVSPFDNEYSDRNYIVWHSILKKHPKKQIPFSPTIINDNIIFLPTNESIYAFDVESGVKLAEKKLFADKKNKENGYFGTINSACVYKKRIYLATESSVRSQPPCSRLYAIDINIKEDKKDFFKIAWYFPFIGRSQASPLYINGTIYFDGYMPMMGIPRIQKSYIYALQDFGDYYRVYRRSHPYKTWFSFSKDPRGGFWYEDAYKKRLVHFILEDGRINFVEEIYIKNLVGGMLNIYRPMSCMTICGGIKKPIMLISSFSLWPRQYLFAVNLKENNSKLWGITVDNFGWNYPGGQFTILNKHNGPRSPRILFGTYFDGVVAIGEKE